MKGEIIVVDVDDVLRDFVPTVVKKYNELQKSNYTINDVTDWEIRNCLPKIVNFEYFIRVHSKALLVDAPSIKNSLYTIRKLEENNIITIATHQFKGLEKYTLDWLTNNNVNYNNIFFSYDKYLTKGDMIVDDKPINVEQFIKYNRGSIGYLINKPWNTDFVANDKRIHRINSIVELLDL